MNEYTTIVKDIISSRSGINVNEIKVESFFKDDLNIGELDLIEILGEIEETLKVDLSEERDAVETVGDIISLLNEKLE